MPSRSLAVVRRLDFELVELSCFRMLNQDITDLFERVDVGTQVVVTR
jgi:hypothetical protein